MTESHWNLLTNALLLVTVLCLWIGKRRERLKADEEAAAMRGKHRLASNTLWNDCRGYSPRREG